jgi:thiol-disulfide isomerase/thioredoxin
MNFSITARPLTAAIALALLASAAERGHGQTSEPPARPELPASADQWFNSSPLTYDGIKGKSAVLWYFEETCPNCEKKWPALKQLAEEHADEPVLFIAVNSGSDPRALAAYLERNDIDWPVLYDPDRSFEAASGVGEISLQNVHQVKLILADGKFATGRWNDLPGSVTKALDGAAWKVKYDRLHEAMHAAVRRMEFGDFRPSAVAIRNGLKDKSPEVRKAAEQVQQHVERQMKQAIDAAAASATADDLFARYQALQTVADQFAPHKLPKEQAAELAKLAKDPAVQKEIRAAKAVDAQAALLASPDERVRQRATAVLERVGKSFPGTRGAARAQELLANPPAVEAAADDAAAGEAGA